MNKKKNILFALLLVSILTFSGVAYPWGAASGDGSRYLALQETAVFFNNTGSTIVSGLAMVLDRSGAGVSAGTTLGAFVTTSTTADVSGVVGVVKCEDGCSYIDQGPVVIVTKGPAEAYVHASDGVVSGDYVGTATQPGAVGRFDSEAIISNNGIVGWALETCASTENDCVIWVNPQ